MYTVETDEQPENPFWTVSNALSLLRVVLTPSVLWMIWAGPDYRWGVFCVVMVMVASDVLDGHFARRRGEITRWGKILDPLADKLAIDSITIVLVLVKGLPAWVAAVVVGRDVLIVVAGVLLMGKKRIVVSSNMWGKLTTLVMSALLLSYAMDAMVLQIPLLVLAVFLLAASFVSYGLQYFQLAREA
ncbi:MAG: CDP-alcohol phosphatidyltransferase family protein [bacterium]|nr:CDP-alcohol phosphatidyltransferase family protein [bacterium]